MELKSWLTQNKNETKYNLRPTTILFIQPNATKTNCGDYTFKNFFAHLFNKLDMLRQNFTFNNSNIILYKKEMFKHFDALVSDFLNIFPKFAFNPSKLNFYYK